MPLFVQQHVNLARFNTLAISAFAERLLVVDSLACLKQWQQQRDNDCYFVLGGGSNTVFAGDIHELVLFNRITGRQIASLGNNEALVTAGAGENWHEFVVWTLQQGWFGLENLALIPGTVGASPIQNIGAYGVEMCQRFHSLTALNVDTGELVCMDGQDCGFSYRHSVFKEAEGSRYIVVDVTFRLSAGADLVLDYGDVKATLASRGIQQPTPMDVCEAVQFIRRQKLPDPAQLPNAGSFFKNPILNTKAFEHFIAQHPNAVYYAMPDDRYKLAAGWLIDQLGWKGRYVGPVQVNERQALVLINHGGSGRDVLMAATAIAADVHRHFGVQIEMEPRVVGGSY